MVSIHVFLLIIKVLNPSESEVKQEREVNNEAHSRIYCVQDQLEISDIPGFCSEKFQIGQGRFRQQNGMPNNTTKNIPLNTLTLKDEN